MVSPEGAVDFFLSLLHEVDERLMHVRYGLVQLVNRLSKTGKDMS